MVVGSVCTAERPVGGAGRDVTFVISVYACEKHSCQIIFVQISKIFLQFACGGH